MLTQSHLVETSVNTLVAGSTHEYATLQIAALKVTLKKTPAMDLARNEMVKRQRNLTLTSCTSVRLVTR